MILCYIIFMDKINKVAITKTTSQGKIQRGQPVIIKSDDKQLIESVSAEQKKKQLEKSRDLGITWQEFRDRLKDGVEERKRNKQFIRNQQFINRLKNNLKQQMEKNKDSIKQLIDYLQAEQKKKQLEEPCKNTARQFEEFINRLKDGVAERKRNKQFIDLLQDKVKSMKKYTEYTKKFINYFQEKQKKKQFEQRYNFQIKGENRYNTKLKEKYNEKWQKNNQNNNIMNQNKKQI